MKVTIGRNRKVNLGNYENIDINIELTAECPVEGEPEEIERLTALCEDYIEAEVAMIVGEAEVKIVKADPALKSIETKGILAKNE